MKAFSLLAGLLGVAAAAPLAPRDSNWWYAAQDHSLSSQYYSQQGDIVESISPNDGAGLAASIANNGRPDFSYNGDAGDKYLSGAPRVIYLPPGTYELDSSLYMYTDTVILGDASAPPTIKPSSSFNGNYLVVGGRGGEDARGGELHFSVMIKNVILDTTSYGGDITALSWRVAQNSALANVQIKMPQGKHTGIFLGQGSTVSVSEVSFEGGSVGFSYSGHQQAELKGFTFTNTDTAIRIDGGWVVSIFANTFNSVKTAIEMVQNGPYVSAVDCKASGVSGNFFQVDNGDGNNLNFMIENLDAENVSGDLVNVGGQSLVASKSHMDTYIYGNLAGQDYVDNPHRTDVPEEQNGRPSRLAPNGRYPVAVAPSYADKTAADVVNVKDKNSNGNRNVAGNNQDDDTAALQAILNDAASSGKIVFFPAGVYIVTDTLTIPPGSQIIGEAWSTISGSGDAFAHRDSPKAVVAVGEANSSGTAQIQDMRFTVQTPLEGAIIVQINMNGPNPGDVAIYNSLITVGGTSDAKFDSCYDESSCLAAHTGFLFAPGSSAMASNIWSWVADHNADGASGGTSAAGKYGVVVRATDATWLEGVGTEHWWNAQIFYDSAENVLTTLLQSETNYLQAPSQDKPRVPAPYGASGSDPDYTWCNGDTVCLTAANEFVSGGKNLYHYAAGSYYFQDGKQGNMYVSDGKTQNWQMYGPTTHQSYANMLVAGKAYGSDDATPGSWGSAITAWMDNRQSTPA